MVRVSGVLQVFVDDRLANRKGLPQNMPATKCDAKLKGDVSTMVRKMTKDGFPSDVFNHYSYKSPGVFGVLFGRTETAEVELVKFETSWDAKGVMRWSFVWDVPAPDVDLQRVREQIAGGISDGWGEGVEQMFRFGPICVSDDYGTKGETTRLATSKEKKGLNAGEHGRYAVLLTTVGAKFAINK